MKRTSTTLSFLLIAALHLILGTDDTSFTINAFTPRAINDTIALVYEDSATLIDCLANDYNSMNGQGSFKGGSQTIISPPHHGKVVFAAHPDILYTPLPNYYDFEKYVMADSFAYAVTFSPDANPELYIIDTAWVFIDSIAGINDVPIAQRDSIEAKQGEGSIRLAPLSNDKDPDLAGVKVRILEGPKHGNLQFLLPAIAGQHLFFPNHGLDYNTNLQKNYALRDTSYLNDTILEYTPKANFFGYDSIRYIVSEYRPASIPPIPSVSEDYTYVYNTDADTTTITIFVEAIDYIPVAVNDTVIFEEDRLRTTPNQFWRPQYNDLDADTLPDDPRALFDMPYILKDTADLKTAVKSPVQEVVFYHDIPVYDSVKEQMVMVRDSNVATWVAGRLRYTYAPYFSGVDSLFYVVIEKKLGHDPADPSKYPDAFRKDTSNFGVFYFVVKPSNQLPYANPDTIVFDWNKVDTLANGRLAQYYDILANDVDIDTLSKQDIATIQRFVDEDLSPMLQWDSMHLVCQGDILRTNPAPRHGTALCYGDSVFYQFNPPYDKSYIIDSFEYLVLDGSGRGAHHAWVYVANTPVKANDISVQATPPLVENEADSTLAVNILLVGHNDDRIHPVYDVDTLVTPRKSAYAQVLRADEGSVNYFFHKGFTTSDRFQYILSDYLTYDTAWVQVNNSPCIAHTDTFVFSDNPFAIDYLTMPWDAQMDVKLNDVDLEGVKTLLPFAGDTLESDGMKLWLDDGELMMSLKKAFFYKDSIRYKLTDLPVFFEAEGLFTRDSAWLYVIDDNGLVDSDGDGIPNLMENGEAGYQAGEDTLDTDGDGDPNYLDDDADNDGLKDAGDCDGDGVMNFLDPDPNCNELVISNAFTPNNDGVNDYFVISEIQLSTTRVIPASIRIYDRYGMLVYENDAYGKDGNWWDGTMGDVKSLLFGDELADGVYVYYITYNGTQQQGYVHIKR